MIRAKNTKTFGAAPKAPQFHKRRKPIEGEDLNALKNVMREIEGQRISVEDFILLIAPHTGDKGASLTKVMADDLNNFRKFCNGAYDTMTKDTNEVMATTQIELGQLYAERTRLLTLNIINCMKAIHDYIPDFNLEEYNIDPDKYLANHFNILDLPDEVEIDIAKRQIAYHRLNWLQSEGDRLSAENNKLQQRLNELKKIQQKDIVEQITKEREAETQRIALEQQQAEMQNQLENLVEELLEAIVNEEEKTIVERKGAAMKSLTKKVKPGSKRDSVKSKESSWSTRAAQDIERSNIQAATALPAPATSTIKSAPNVTSQSQMRQPAPSRLRAPAPRRIVAAPPSTSARALAVSASASEQSQKLKARPATRKKVAKKPVPLAQRPAWQDVNFDADDGYQAAAQMEQTPIDIFAIGRPRSTCPPTCSSDGGPPEARTMPAAPQTQQPRPRPPPGSQPTNPPRQIGRRAAAPRDTWSGFY